MITQCDIEVEIEAIVNHEGDYVAYGEVGEVIAFGRTEEALAEELRERGLVLHQVVVSRYRQSGESFVF